MAIKLVVDLFKNILREITAFLLKEVLTEVILKAAIQWLQSHHLCALVKWMFRRAKYLSHQMMLAAGEDEMHMLGKLDIRT